MTKSEVRAISLSRLELKPGAVLYDVGAGTGSVSIEAALSVPGCQVFAVERKPEAAELISRNREKFHAGNVTVVEGTAPEAFASLPIPTRAFLGGTAGRMGEILDRLLEKNPALRVKKYANLAQNPGPEELDAANAYADSVAGKIRARLSHPDGDEKKGSDQE